MNKYLDSFNEWKLFFIKLGLVNEEGIVGYTHDEIIDQMDYFNLKINENGEYYNYLRTFGKQVLGRTISFLGDFNKYDVYGTGRLIEMTSYDKNDKILMSLKSDIKILLSTTDSYKQYCQMDFLIVGMSEEGDMCTFVFPQDENCFLGFYYSEMGYIHVIDMLRTNPRRWLFSCLDRYVFRAGKNSYGISEYIYYREFMTQLPYSKYLVFFLKDKRENRQFLHSKKDIFIRALEEEERSLDKLYSIDDFMRKYIIHLIEEHNAPYLPDIYDPYKDRRTFREYLQ